MAANPNTFNMQEVWDKTYQVTHHKVPVYPAVANFRLLPGLKKGDKISRQYRSSLVAYDMGGDGGYYRQSVTDTKETLTVNYEKETSFYIKELDELQSNLPLRVSYARDAAVAIFNQIDGDVLGQYDQFSNTLDDGDLGGTAGNGITVTTSNIVSLFSKTTTLLKRNNINLDPVAAFTGVRAVDRTKRRGVAILSPDVYQVLIEHFEGKATALGDKVGINGHAGRFMGYDLFVSNAIGWSGVLLMGTNPTAGDTVTINGVTFTFVSSLANAGDVKIGASASASVTNLVAAINDSENLSAANGGAGEGTVGTAYVEISEANRKLLHNVVATDGTTQITIKATGHGFLTVSETLTASADVWTPEKQIQHCLIGAAGAIDTVIQKQPSMVVKPRDGKVGHDIVTWAAYGIKVFHESLNMLVDVQVRTDSYA